jgi:hypothetical protein
MVKMRTSSVDGRKFQPGRKGIAPIVAIVAVVMMSAMVLEGAIVNNFIGDWEVMKRSARETVFISVIDSMEYLKDSLRQGISYSFYTAAYDVLGNGSFCEANISYCDDRCFLPSSVPSLGCQAWWKVYDTVYAPEYKTVGTTPPDPYDGTFLGYLAARFDSYYSNYSSQFGGSAACPMSPGEVNITGLPDYLVGVVYKGPEGSPLETSAEFSYSEKSDSIKVTERNTQFTDSFQSAALDIFTFARKAFVDDDVISGTFQNQSDNMPLSCRKIPIGDTCSIVGGTNICESKLAASCVGSDNSCDSNKDGRVSADELYGCSVKAAWKSDISSSSNPYVKATINTGCQKTGHNVIVEATSAWTVSWTEAATDTDASGVDAATRCASIKDGGCGCEVACTGSDPECGSCATFAPGTYPGTCPFVTMDCPIGCCASGLTCRQNAPTCSGTNTAQCLGSGDPCCQTTPACQCGECQDARTCADVTCAGTGCNDDTCCMLDSCASDAICQCSDSCSDPSNCNSPCCYVDLYSSTGEPISCAAKSKPACCTGSCEKRVFTCDGCCASQGDVSTGQTYSPKDCSLLGSCSCSGCSVRDTYTIGISCEANACDQSCCKQTATLYKDANCTYDYWGTVNASVTVADQTHSYPIYGGWKQLATSFFVASGNAPQCTGVKSTNITEFKDDAACCQAINSTVSDSLGGCRLS